MALTTPCVKRRRGWLRKHKTDSSRSTGALSISNSPREISMYLKALLVTVVLGILLYALCESKPHHRPRKHGDLQEVANGDDEDDTKDGSGCQPTLPVARICERKPFYVNLTDLLGVKVISPTGLIDIGVCGGECSSEVIGKSGNLPPYNNAFRTRAVIRTGRKGHGFCIPDVLSPLPYYSQQSECGIRAIQHVADAVVERCGCVL